ncbi:MAG TPA: hypothetical protein VFJ18_14630 [Pararhizobium sp.]|nr:hypothetical protein [Pararhizobium sp.]
MIVRDGAWSLHDYDFATGRSVWALFDGEKTVFRVDTPVQSTLDANAEARNSASSGWKGDYHRIASVPMQLLYDGNLGLNKAFLEGDDRYVKRWLNDGQNRAWRVKEGNV